MSGLPWFGREYSIYFKISSGGGDWLRLAGGWGLVSGCYGFLGCMCVVAILRLWGAYVGQALVFVWDGAMRESSSFSFSAFFCRYQKNFVFGGKTGH